MKINEIKFDAEKLLSMQETLDSVKENGGTNSALADIRESHYDMFGNELIWAYPKSTGMYEGVVIVAVREGFLSLPYEEVDIDDYEIFKLEDAAMLDADALQAFIDDWIAFSSDLVGALGDMLRIVRGDSPPAA